MKNLKFNTLSDFSVHGVQWIAENVGHASMQRMGCINDKHTGLDLKNVQHYVATALQENFCVPVYLKENVCSSSKMVIIAMHWSSLWKEKDGWTNVVNTRIGPGRKEMHYQKCLSVELRSMGIPVVMEDPVPVYYQGEMVWQGRADLVVGRCCIELKAINKPPSTAGRQLHDYITEKNKVVMLQNSMPSEFFNNGCTSAKELKTCEDLLYWGLVINFNPASGAVETFIPFRKKNAATSQQSKGVEEKVYMDTELLGCRVKMHDIRGMVDSITAGCSGEILFQVQFSDGRRCSMLRKDLEPILSDVDIAVSSDLKQKNTISAFHSSVACFAKNRLRKTTDPAKFVTYKALVAAFEDFSSVKIDGGSMWFRNFMQKNFRVTYRKVDGTSREMVLFGGVGKGLLVTRG